MMSKYKSLTKVCETNRLHWNRSLMPNMRDPIPSQPIDFTLIRALVEDLETQRRAIVDQVAKADPARSARIGVAIPSARQFQHRFKIAGESC